MHRQCRSCKSTLIGHCYTEDGRAIEFSCPGCGYKWEERSGYGPDPAIVRPDIDRPIRKVSDSGGFIDEVDVYAQRDPRTDPKEGDVVRVSASTRHVVGVDTERGYITFRSVWDGDLGDDVFIHAMTDWLAACQNAKVIFAAP